MSVYVDGLVLCVPNKHWRYNKSCHLIADTEDELHEFARRIGLKREWAQCGFIITHYDLTGTKRRLAIRMGAVSITRKFFVKLLKKYKKGVGK